MNGRTLVALAATLAVACLTQQQAQFAENLITDITGAVCTPLEQQTNNVYVDFVCNIAEAAEGTITVLTSTQTTATLAKTQVTIRVPAAQAAAFTAEHTATAVAARKAARGK